MKTIAFAIEKFSRYAGGAESYAVALATFLMEKGWEVHLFGEMWDGKPEGAVFHKIAVPKYVPSWLRIVLFALKHRRAVKNRDYDIVMGFGNTLYMNVYQSHGGVHWLSTKRKVYSETNKTKRIIKRLIIALTPKQWARAWIESAPFRLKPQPRIVAISEMIKKDMKSFFGVKGEHIDVVYNGVDTSLYNEHLRREYLGPLRRELGIRAHEVVFLFIAYDLKKKGIGPLIGAASQLKKKGYEHFKVIVLGGQPDGFLLRKIKALDIEDKVLFKGPVRSMEAYYANSDVLVLPTYYDACSLVVIEAMACGLPSITTTYNGASGMMTDGRDGYIVSHPPNKADLANRMELLLDNETRREMARNALRTGRRYSAKKNHEEMIRIFGEVSALKEAR